ncbi:MAG TPA: hypothetical protein VMD59_24690, partial [Acidimicrobiales bacterium]|nr:hypothetical protein [Acidimicrobiales bacterium]
MPGASSPASAAASTAASIRKSIMFLALLAALLVAMAVDAGGRDTVVVLGPSGIDQTPVVDASVSAVCAVAAALCAAGVLATLWRRATARARLVAHGCVGTCLVGFLVGYLTWAAHGESLGLSAIVANTVI